MAADDDELLALLGRSLVTVPVEPAAPDVAFQRRLVLERRAAAGRSPFSRGLRVGVGLGFLGLAGVAGVAAASQGVLPAGEAPSPASAVPVPSSVAVPAPVLTSTPATTPPPATAPGVPATGSKPTSPPASARTTAPPAPRRHRSTTTAAVPSPTRVPVRTRPGRARPGRDRDRPGRARPGPRVPVPPGSAERITQVPAAPVAREASAQRGR